MNDKKLTKFADELFIAAPQEKRLTIDLPKGGCKRDFGEPSSTLFLIFFTVSFSVGFLALLSLID